MSLLDIIGIMIPVIIYGDVIEVSTICISSGAVSSALATRPSRTASSWANLPLECMETPVLPCQTAGSCGCLFLDGRIVYCIIRSC